MKKLSLLVAMLFVVVSQPMSVTLAQDSPHYREIENAKTDLNNLYRQWRQDNPQDPIGFQAFNVYLYSKRKPVFDSYRPHRKLSNYYTALPSGNTVVLVSEAPPSHFAFFVIDTNGSQLPNRKGEDQHILLMDNNGLVFVQE